MAATLAWAGSYEGGAPDAERQEEARHWNFFWDDTGECWRCCRCLVTVQQFKNLKRHYNGVKCRQRSTAQYCRSSKHLIAFERRKADQLGGQNSFDTYAYSDMISSDSSVRPRNHFVQPHVLQTKPQVLLPPYVHASLVQHPCTFSSTMENPLTAQHHQQRQDCVGFAYVHSHGRNTGTALQPFQIQSRQSMNHSCLHVPGNLHTAAANYNPPLAPKTWYVPGTTQAAAPGTDTPPSVLHPNVQLANLLPLTSSAASPSGQPSLSCAPRPVSTAPCTLTTAQLTGTQPSYSSTTMTEAMLHAAKLELQLVSSPPEAKSVSPSTQELRANNSVPAAELNAQLVGKRASIDQALNHATLRTWDPMLPKTQGGQVDKLAVLSHCANAGQFCDDPLAMFKLACIDMCTVEGAAGPQAPQPGLLRNGNGQVDVAVRTAGSKFEHGCKENQLLQHAVQYGLENDKVEGFWQYRDTEQNCDKGATKWQRLA